MSRSSQDIDRAIMALALPSLGALLAEPLFLLVDTALVGHLGSIALAGVGIAQAVLNTLVGLLVFLAYATTPRVARRLGAGDRAGALQAGIDGLWLAILVGAVSVGLLPATGWLTGLFGASEAVTAVASSYLRISLWGVPAMLVTFASVGLMRGLQDARTPLVVAGIGLAANVCLNVLFIYGMGMGVVGSALGTIITQWGMALFYVSFALSEARRAGVSPAPHLRGVLSSAGFGGWLLLRTAALRVALLATTWTATSRGTEVLATTQIAFTLFTTAAFALDALAMAGQAMIGEALGAQRMEEIRLILRRLLRLAVLCGVSAGVVLLVSSPWIGRAFTGDVTVLGLLPGAIVMLALGQPIAGVVFALDGILIGAGDARYLAWTGVVNLLVYLPLLFVANTMSTSGAVIVAIWGAFSLGYVGARLATLSLRAKGSGWMRAGSC